MHLCFVYQTMQFDFYIPCLILLFSSQYLFFLFFFFDNEIYTIVSRTVVLWSIQIRMLTW